MNEVTLIVGGSVGSDPYSAKTWSGSCLSLVRAMERAEVLDKAVGMELSRVQKSWLLAKNFTSNREVWRKHFFFDPAYRKALTARAGEIAVKSPVLMQLGSMFSLPDVFPDRKCISYHDGNLAQMLGSGFGMNGVSRKRIDQALRYEEETSQKMAAIFTFSEYLRQSFISDYHVAPEKVFCVGGASNFTEIPAIDPEKDYSVQRVLFVGVDFKRKGGSDLLEAWRVVREALPKAELHIVGPEAMATVPDGVVFHGRLSTPDAAQKAKLGSLFRDASLFVLPSHYEPFGIAPLEAMFYGLPCLLTDDWAFREFVTPGVNGDLVRKGAVAELAGKMVSLLADPVELAAMGKRARERVSTGYTWDAVVERMTAAIRTL